MFGFVDHIDASGVAGWCVGRGTQPLPGRGRWASRVVVVSVNDIDRFSAFCQDPRPDVVRAGAARDPHVGFRAPLALKPGDLVRVRFGLGGHMLQNGVAVIGDEPLRGRANDSGFMPLTPYGGLDAYRQLLEPLRARFKIEAFRPLFGQTGTLAAMALQTPDGRTVVPMGMPAARARRQARLYRELLAPHRIACPAISLRVDAAGGVMLCADYVAGITLDKHGLTDTRAMRTIIEWAKRLNDLKPTPALVSQLRERTHADRLIARSWRQLLVGRRGGDLRLILAMLWSAGGLPRVFSHGDLHRENVIVEAGSGRPLLIDWDNAGLLPLGADLARLLLGVPPRQAEAWIGGSRQLRLGWSLFTYLSLALRQADFIGSADASYLAQRFQQLSRPTPASQSSPSRVRSGPL
ncbi:aminoglycoside phosphotransferase family protein [Salinicola sp. RZ23]|uniref:aminoglycoside phosphotransferase family protein n=1 Tax=Salinicola sp. RZ23 TaxID=1949087 RepID=UPI000DA1B62F|nr:aminoglycoside phosphotransferase family protein [Salinicola sp. RZ23]